MEGMLKMVNKMWEWIAGICAFLLGSFLWYQYTDVQNLKKEMSDKYVKKEDWNIFVQQNREDHRKLEEVQGKIFDKFDELKTLIIQEVKK